MNLSDGLDLLALYNEIISTVGVVNLSPMSFFGDYFHKYEYGI